MAALTDLTLAQLKATLDKKEASAVEEFERAAPPDCLDAIPPRRHAQIHKRQRKRTLPGYRLLDEPQALPALIG